MIFYNYLFERFVSVFNDRINFFSSLVIILPIALISGNGAIPDIIISLIAIFFLITSIKNKEFIYYKNTVFILFIIFSVYGVIRSFFSEYIWESLTDEGTIFYFRFILFSMGIQYLINKNSKLILNLTKSISFCIIFVFVDGTYQFLNGSNIFGIEPLSSYRMTSVMGEEAKLGRYVAFLSAILVILMNILPKLKSKKIILIALIPISLYVIFISGDRAPLLRYLIFLCLFILFLKDFKKEYLISFILTIFASLIFVYNSPLLKDRIIDTTIRDITSTSFKIAPFSSHYEEHYYSAYKMGSENLIFGIGPNLFEKNCHKTQYKISDRSCSSHPHNFFMQLFAELGIFGLSFFVLFYISILFGIIKFSYKKFFSDKIYNQSYNIGPNIYLFCFLLPLIPNMSFYNHWNNIFIFFVIGLLLYSNQNNTEIKT